MINQTIVFSKAALTGCLCIALGSTQAQTITPRPLSVLANAGTTGLSLTISQSHHNSKWVPRADLGYLAYDTTGREGNVTYDFDLKMSSLILGADYHFFNGHFKGGVGVALIGSDFTLEGKPNGAGVYDINGQLVPAGQNDFVRAEVELPPVAPYFGIGWSNLNQVDTGFKYSVDLGAAIGAIDTTLRTSDNVRNAAGEENIEAERRKIDDAVDKGFVPVIRVGFGMNF